MSEQIKPNYERIWLSPRCEEPNRVWCQDDVWDGACEDCGAPSVEYIRADLAIPKGSVAVPRELLERACKDYTGRENWDALEPDRLAAAVELRALLSKEGE